MLVENPRGTPDPATSREKPPSLNDSQRWLAELEREFLQATASAPPASREHAAGRSPESSTTRRDTPAATHAPVDGPATRGRGDAVPDRADTRRESADMPVTAEATATMPAATPATSPATGLADARLAMPSVASTPADAPAATIALSPTSVADRALGLRTRPDDPAGTSSRAPAPRYARQLMSLTEGEHASATIRDASLSPADSGRVAHNVSLQLQAAGLGVHRIFINGQRFDSTPTGVAARPDRLPPLFQDDDA